MITGVQIRMALGALKWSRGDLAERSGVSLRSVERVAVLDGVPNMSAANLAKLQEALEAGGVQFVPGGAVFLPAAPSGG